MIGISILSGAHMHLFPKIMALVKANQMDDVLVFGGGIIPEGDVPQLQAMGVAAIFPPGTSTQSVIDFLKERFQAAKA